MASSGEYKARELGDEASRILNSEVWATAWDAYRQRILEEIERSPSADVERVMHLKRLLTAAAAARGHMERLIGDGAVAAANIAFDEAIEKNGKKGRTFRELMRDVTGY